MGRPCGCAGAGVDIRGRNGILVTPPTGASQTYWVELDPNLGGNACNIIMNCVRSRLGPGLQGNPDGSIQVKLDSDPNNLIQFGAGGGLLALGSGGTPSPGGASVANLPTGAAAVIGATYGAGNAMWPEGTRDSIEAAAGLAGTALHITHLPLRKTAELLPVVAAYPTMQAYNASIPEAFVDLDESQLQRVEFLPADTTEGVNVGYFGFGALRHQGATLLGDALNLVGNKLVVWLEIKDTTTPNHTAAIAKPVLSQWNANKSVIVVGEPIPASGGPATILDGVIEAFAGSGVAIGAHLRTKQQVLDNPGAALAAKGVQWVAIPAGVIDDEGPDFTPGALQGYKDAGLQVLMGGVVRRWQFELARRDQLRGTLSADPVYTSGFLSGYRYRRRFPRWNWSNPDYGQHSNHSGRFDLGDGLRDHYRGYVRSGQGDQIVLDSVLQVPGAVEPFVSGYFINVGKVAPLENADTYAVTAWFWWDRLIEDRNRWVGIWVDRPTDRSLLDWDAATRHTIGYNVHLNQNGQVSVFEYDGTPGRPPAARQRGPFPSGYTIQPQTWYGLRVEMTSAIMRVFSTTTFTDPGFSKSLITEFPNPNRYITGTNTGHVLLGRHFFNNPDSCEVRFGWNRGASHPDFVEYTW